MSDCILIVDDEASVSQMLSKIVKSNGYSADIADSADKALEMTASNEYALMLLDINMPEKDGFQVIEELRSHGNQIPVIIVSGRKEDFDTLYGLEIGADDYVVKPFNPVTLGAKIKALVRRSRSFTSKLDNVITVGPFTYNTSTLRFSKNGSEIALTGKENAIMKLFLDNVNRIFTKDMLYDMVWGSSIVDENSIMVYINRLRQKIEDDPESPHYIQTVRGIGYRFVV